MTLTREDPELLRPIEDSSQLLDYFRAGEKPRERWRVGTEHEKLGLLRESLAPIPYEGERGIRALLERLRRDHGFAPLLDAGKLVGLERDAASITLEPGGQLELSGAPLWTLHETCKEFNDHLALLKHVSEAFGLVWLGLGVQPFVGTDGAARMPRERYAIMRDYLGRRDRLGLQMMHLTAGVQASFDYSDERDMARKLRLALAVSPVQTALWANSPISRGAVNGYVSWRAHIWRFTDPDRCGLLPFAFEPEWGEGSAYQRYADWALDAPMFFVVRDGHHVPMAGRTFREHLKSGQDGEPATLADWELHLTTLFPEVRLKRLIEVRGADAVPPGLVCALPAFWKGLFYDPEALASAEQRLERWTHAEVDRLHLDVARLGLRAQAPDAPVLTVAGELLELAAAGLGRIGAHNSRGEDESLFLEPLLELVQRGTSPARDLLERWEAGTGDRRALVVDHARY